MRMIQGRLYFITLVQNRILTADAKDAEKPIFYLAVRGRQIKRLLLLWDRALNSLYSLQRVPVLWSKGRSFCSNRRLPLAGRTLQRAGPIGAEEIFLSDLCGSAVNLILIEGYTSQRVQ
jgi:hypothetical protein